MEAAIQMNTRIGRALKERGDAVLAQQGFTPSQAVRALWSFFCEHQDVPAFMTTQEDAAVSAERERKLELIRANVGLALSIARTECGYTGPNDVLGGKTWHELQDDMYDNMLDEMEVRCR